MALKALYVEDEPVTGRLVEQRLKALGYEVVLADSFSEGLRCLERGTYSVVLADYMLPDGDGLSVLEAAKACVHAPPVVMVTGHGSESIAVTALKAGAVDYVVKDEHGAYLDLLPMVIRRAVRDREFQQEREQAVAERERLIDELRQALARIKELSGLLPICSSCKKIQDEQGQWHRIETYLRGHSAVRFSHGLCPECERHLYPDLTPDRDRPEDAKW